MIHRASRDVLVATVAAVIVMAHGAAARAQFGSGGGFGGGGLGGAAVSEPVPAPAKSIEQKLKEKTKFEFIDEELNVVAQAIAEQNGFAVELDRRALEDAGVGTDLPITISVQGIPLGAALDLMLDDADLTYIIRDDYLLITTSGEAEGMLETRVYSVGDLLDHIGGGATMDDLVNVIQATTEPTTWDTVGGEGSAQPLGDLLVVATTQRTHREIIDLLEKLRAAPAESAATQARRDDVPEGRSRWELRVYSTRGLVANELRQLLYTLVPQLADISKTRLITVERKKDQEGEAADDAMLEELGLPQGTWLAVGQHPRVQDRLAALLGEGKLIEGRDAPPPASSNMPGFGGGGFGGGFGGGGGAGGGFGGGGGGGGFF